MGKTTQIEDLRGETNKRKVKAGLKVIAAKIRIQRLDRVEGARETCSNIFYSILDGRSP